MLESKHRSGGCLCGAVTYCVDGPVAETVACYCKMCQRATGNFVVASQFSEADLTVKGVEYLEWYASAPSSKRGFCKCCGSQMFFKVIGSDRISAKTGTFDDTSDMQIRYSIFVEAAGGHCLIDSDAPRSQGYPVDDPNYPFNRVN